MGGGIITKRQQELGGLGFAGLPAIISAAGERASFRFIEFFTANIRNPNTRVSYGRAVREFCQWCEDRGLSLEDLNPVVVAGYIERLGMPVEKHGRGYSKPSVKQHLAAIRMLFDYLVTGGILPMNPASSVRGPKYSIKRGKTPVLSAEEARQLLAPIRIVHETEGGSKITFPGRIGAGRRLEHPRSRDNSPGYFRESYFHYPELPE